MIVLAVVGLLYVRVAPHDPAKWHVDPAAVQEVDPLNQYIGRASVGGERKAVAGLLERLIVGEVLAGSFETGFVTVIARTPMVGYPDYISVRIEEENADTSRVTIFSRSRFGVSDLGANKARVEALIGGLKRGLAASS